VPELTHALHRPLSGSRVGVDHVSLNTATVGPCVGTDDMLVVAFRRVRPVETVCGSFTERQKACVSVVVRLGDVVSASSEHSLPWRTPIR
jgi:hypothetical protein